MQTIHLKGEEIHISGELPAIGSVAPDFQLVKDDLSTVTLEDFRGQYLLLNIFPSIDTGVCYSSVKRFASENLHERNISVACVSMDLPFALQRKSKECDFSKLQLLSAFRHRQFGDKYGITIVDGPLAGLLARAVIILDGDFKVVYQQLVPEITEEPNYETALAALA